MSSHKGTALVTGASQGIGKAIALRLAADGYAVAVNDVPSKIDALQAVVDEISGNGGRAVAIPGDAAEEEDVKMMVAKALAELGDLMVFVANAGVLQIGGLFTTSLETWDRIAHINVRGVFIGYREAASQMIKQGKGGCIIGASSSSGKTGSPQLMAYSTSKFAVRGLTQCAARELGAHNIRVNAYAPGPIDTNMWENIDRGIAQRKGQAVGKLTEQQAAVTALGRIGTVEDVADVVGFLVSPAARHVTGQTLSVDGGLNFD